MVREVKWTQEVTQNQCQTYKDYKSRFTKEEVNSNPKPEDPSQWQLTVSRMRCSHPTQTRGYRTGQFYTSTDAFQVNEAPKYTGQGHSWLPYTTYLKKPPSQASSCITRESSANAYVYCADNLTKSVGGGVCVCVCVLGLKLVTSCVNRGWSPTPF